MKNDKTNVALIIFAVPFLAVILFNVIAYGGADKQINHSTNEGLPWNYNYEIDLTTKGFLVMDVEGDVDFVEFGDLEEYFELDNM